ncbi:MAG: TetR/AcrR family transcriptional regulator [Acidimicrobiales bacterium]
MTEIESSRQQERREASTRALLHAAGDLAVEGGVKAMTFAAIGERADLSRSMVTARFGNKDGMIDALVTDLVGRWSHRTLGDDLNRLSGLQAVLAFFDAIAAQAAKRSHGLRVLWALMAEATTDPALAEHFRIFHRDMRRDMVRVLQRGQNDGSIRPDVDVDAVAGAIVASFRGVGYQWLIDPDQFDPVPALHFHRDALEHHLTTNKDAGQ